jgi:bacillithiol system protein YtxJ
MGFRFRKKAPKGNGPRESDSAVRRVTTEAELVDAVGEGPSLIYKHSHRCGLCFRSAREVQKFAAGRPDIPVLMIDVVADRDLSNRVAERFGVWHQSPQAIVIREGRAIWDASHLGVTASAVEAALAS